MNDILNSHQPAFQKTIDHLKEELTGIRTGRANGAVVENVMVEAYGSRQALVGLASITVPDARSILIEPWDKSIVKDVEKGIIEAKLGLNPAVQGQQIRIAIPALTEESRKNLMKLVGERLEDARISIRNVREQAKAEIQRAEKDKAIAEDEKYKLLEQLDKVAAGFNERIRAVGEEKEKDIMTV